jgi:flagellar motor switch protein FliM
VPQKTLSQSQIDALIASAGRKVEEYDYRSGKAFTTTTLAELDQLHKAFARDLSQRLSQMLQIGVRVEGSGTDQARYDSYVHSLPSPTIVAVVELRPNTLVALDLANHLGFAMLDILLGGMGRPTAYRAFTDLEGLLLNEIVTHVATSIGIGLGPLARLDPTVAALQAQPAINHVAIATEPTVVMSFRVTLDNLQHTEGILSICYPRHAIDPILANGQPAGAVPAAEPTGDPGPLAAPLAAARVKLHARLNGSKLSLLELTRLQPGDVVLLGHGTGEPATVSIDGVDLFEGEIGRHDGHMALRLTNWMAK